MVTPGLSASDVTAMLRRHYLPDSKPAGGIFAAEIGAPDGRRRADLIWLPTTTAGGTGLIGHEVKVTRSDVLAELADPTKAESWAQYCERWWLVVADPALVDGLDVPHAWGVMAPPAGPRRRTMTIVRPAPPLDPKEPGRGMRRVAAWQFYGDRDRLQELTLERNQLRRGVDRLTNQLVAVEAAAGAGNGTDRHRAAKVGAILHRVERELRDRGTYLEPTEDEVVQALIDLTATRSAEQHLRADAVRLVNEVRGLTEPFKYHEQELRQVLGRAVTP